MDERQAFGQTRRRFRYDEEHQLDRIQLTNKQRRYKQLLDEQVEHKRRMDQLHRSQEVQQKAWYVQPSESYNPRNPLKGSNLKSNEEEKHGVSRFITEPSNNMQHPTAQNEDDEQVRGYLQECQKILQSLKGLTSSPKSINDRGNSNRKFIRYDRSRHKFEKEGLSELEERYNRQYGNSDGKLPRLKNYEFLTPKSRNKDHMAVIINPTPCTHGEPHEDDEEQRRKREAVSKGRLLGDDLLDIKSTVKVHSSRAGSQADLHNHQEFDQRRMSTQPKTNQMEDRLIERSRKSQLEVNKERFRTLARQPIPSTVNPQSSPEKSFQDKRGSNIMVHLVRVKAHGYKLFEKVKRYNSSKTEAVQSSPRV